MAVHYRHTQVGWVILGVSAAMAVFVHFRLPGPPETPSSVPILAILALVAALFATLTVEVDEGAVRLRFGVGLVRKRIPLAEVGAWEAVLNPWYAGWGIRLGPRGQLWNVSGFGAVELALPNGRRFRVGTDEPDALVRTIPPAKGHPSPGAPGEGWSPLPRRGVGWGVVAVFAVLAALVGYAFWAQVQPPGVTVTAEGFAVDTPFYGRSFAAADVAAVSLEAKLPRVLARTNGFAGAGTLRGHFRVEGLGQGLLYVDQGFPPYVLVRLREGYVFVNFRVPERTRALYEEMARAWPDRVSADAPD
ncbi:MAG TPA: hypothetical protein VGB87_01145 [Vicinamibacteria bacterium]